MPTYWIVDLNIDEVLVLDDPTPDGCRSERQAGRGGRLGVDGIADAILVVDDILGPPSR